MDAGTADSMLEAAEIVKALQKSGCYVGCLEELAWKEGFESGDKVREIGGGRKRAGGGRGGRGGGEKVAILYGR